MHISFDIETWGLTPGCDIRSIGAVVFNPRTRVVHDDSEVFSLYVALENPPTNFGNTEYYDGVGEWRKYPLHRDTETVKWWNSDVVSAEAKDAFINPLPLADGLDEFARWLRRMGDVYAGQEMRLWSKGPHFDVSILAAAYDLLKMETPWHYRAPRDMRTVTDMAGISRDEEKALFVGTPHHALDDAVSQARVICECFSRLGL